MKSSAVKPEDPTGSFGENFAAGAGKAVYDMGRGAGQMLRTVLPNETADKLGLPTEADVAEARKRDEALMRTGGGIAGNIAGNIAATVAIPGSGTLGGAAATGAALGLLQPTVEGESRTANAVIGGVAGAAGKYAGDKVAGAVSSRLASNAADVAANKTANATKDAALAAGKEAGYVVPPTQANPSWINRILEGFSGKIQTAQVASQKNQGVTNSLAKRAVGIADDSPITTDALNDIRKQAGKAYELIRGAGPIQADAQYVGDLGRILSKFEGASKDFPELARNEIADVIASINKPQFSANSAVDAISILRDKAVKAAAGGDKGSASAYRQASQAMEDAIERKLIETGDKGLLKGFQDARQLIAKTYSIEKALSPTGNVNAQALAKQLEKGKPLSGDLRTIADFAANFKKAAQNVDNLGSVPGVSPLDAAVGALTGGPAGAAWFIGRPATRSVLLSRPYQSAMTNPSYRVSDLLRLTEAGINNPLTLRALPVAAEMGGLSYLKQ